MDLGYCKLRRLHCNVLHSAIHGTHGIAWTDGRVIYLTPVTLVNQEIQSAQSLKLGEFEHVDSIHWSSEFSSANGVSNCTTFSYLCVLHKDSTTLWKVTGTTPNLSFKQVRKINIQTIINGSLWNPDRDILCLLSKEKASFYFNHTQNKGSYSLPTIESGQITCGCWSGDGMRLVLGVGAVVLIYQWQDIDESITDYTIMAWKIPGVTGQLCNLFPYKDDRVLCTAELPLDQICTAQENLFHIPDLSLFEGPSRISSCLSSGNSSTSSGSSTHNKQQQLVDGSSSSHINSLLNLKRNSQGMKQDSSQLIMFGLQGKTLEPHKIASQNIPAVLSPDLLYCQSNTGAVVVGSNTHNVLAVFNVQDDTIVPGAMLQLGEGQRPKGVCGCIRTGQQQAEGILVAVASVERNDNAFLPISLYLKYKMSLRYFPLVGQASKTFVQNPKDIPNTKMFREIQLPNGNSKVHLLRIGPLNNQSNINDNSMDTKVFPEKLGNYFNSETASNSSCDTASTNSSLKPGSPLCNLVLPGLQEVVISNEKINGRKVVPLLPNDEEDSDQLEVETQSFDTKPRDFKNMKLVQMFEPPDNSLGAGDNLANEDVQDIHIKPGYSDVYSTDSASASHCARAKSPCYGTEGIKSLHQNFQPNEQSVGQSLGIGSPSGLVRGSNASVLEGQSSENLQSGFESLRTDLNTHGDAVVKEHLQQLERRVNHQESALGKLALDIALLKSNGSSNQPQNQGSAVDSADFVYLNFVQCKDSTEQGTKKAFLLDQGRLQLSIVKECFSIKTLEILLGNEWCVVGCNPQGYIPLQFEPRSSYFITSAVV